MMTYEDAERILCNQCIHNVHCMMHDKECKPMETLKRSQWIPVSEKLPENIKTVLVTIKELEQPILGWYGNKFGWRIVMPEFVNIKDFTVIAWMPLPPAYKEDTNGEND